MSASNDQPSDLERGYEVERDRLLDLLNALPADGSAEDERGDLRLQIADLDNLITPRVEISDEATDQNARDVALLIALSDPIETDGLFCFALSGDSGVPLVSFGYRTEALARQAHEMVQAALTDVATVARVVS